MLPLPATARDAFQLLTRVVADAVAERDNRRWAHPADTGTGYEKHLKLLREAGFRAAGSIWQYGTRHIIAGVN